MAAFRNTFMVGLALLLAGLAAPAYAAGCAERSGPGSASIAVQAHDAIGARLAQAMAEARAHNGFSGAVLVARRGQVLLEGGWGCANYEHLAPNTADTPFRIGSISKPFTATALLSLVRQGRLGLDDSVCDRLSPCPAAWREIRVSQLLDHSAGVPDFVRLPGFRERTTLPTTLAATLGTLRGLPLQHAPGAEAAYGNSGTVIAAAIIETITGQPYDKAMRTLVYEPLGLKRSGYAFDGPLIPGRAAGYVHSGDALQNAPFIDMSVPLAAGSQYSTVGDLYAWEQALEAGRLVGPQLSARMFQPSRFGYSLGFIAYDEPGHPMIGHIGDINGFGAFLARYLDDGLVVIVLSNVEKTKVHDLATRLAAVVRGG